MYHNFSCNIRKSSQFKNVKQQRIEKKKFKNSACPLK